MENEQLITVKIKVKLSCISTSSAVSATPYICFWGKVGKNWNGAMIVVVPSYWQDYTSPNIKSMGGFFNFSIEMNSILVPRAHDPSGLWQGSRALAVPDFLSMRRVFVSYSQPIDFPDLTGSQWIVDFRCWSKPELARVLDPCHRPEGSWALGTRMIKKSSADFARSTRPIPDSVTRPLTL